MAKKKDGPTSQSSIQVLPNNINVWDSPLYWENTCRVLPPSPENPGGMILVHPGQILPFYGTLPYQQSAITRPIYDASGNVDRDVSSSIETQLPLPNPNYLGGHTDNHIVRHKDGSFLVMRACMYWASVSTPKPWQQGPLTDYRGSSVTRIGGRGANVCWRGAYSQGPRGTHGFEWALQGAADPFVFNNGGADGYGGSDRPEFYACPFTGYVYLAAKYVPYKDDNGSGPTGVSPSENLVLLFSKNKGKDWEVVTTLSGAASTNPPLVMTSTPNGRLFLYHWHYSAGELFCSNLFDAAAGERPAIHQVYGQEEHQVGDSQNGYSLVFNESLVNYSEFVNGKSVTAQPPDADLATKGVNRISHPSISRVSTDTATSRVRVSLLKLNEYNRNKYVVIDIGVVDKDGLPHIEPWSLRRAGTIEAADPEGHSVLRGSFIDPDYVSMPSGVVSNTAMFYWLDWPGVGASDLSVRYCFFSGWPSHQSGVGPLSVSDGALRTWADGDPGGDYMTGGFFYHNGLNYVPQWRETDGIRANLVHVRPPLIAAPTSSWQRWWQSVWPIHQ